VRTPLGVAAALVALALLGAGCASSDPGRTEVKAAPRDSFPVGSRASFRVDAHCGVEWAVIDGYSWHTRLRDDGNLNPPDDWPQLIDGVLTRTSPDRAVFVSDQIPVRLVFRAAPDAVWSCM
jgi:hypothetical protein